MHGVYLLGSSFFLFSLFLFFYLICHNQQAIFVLFSTFLIPALVHSRHVGDTKRRDDCKMIILLMQTQSTATRLRRRQTRLSTRKCGAQTGISLCRAVSIAATSCAGILRSTERLLSMNPASALIDSTYLTCTRDGSFLRVPYLIYLRA